jgi:DinB superfamily
MKKLILLIILVMIFSEGFAQSTLTTEQRKFASDYLAQTKQDFLKSIDGLTSAQLSFKADSTRWSILECAEHIALAEQGLFMIMQGQLKSQSDSMKRKEIKVSEKEIIGRLTNRTFKVQAPEIIKPTGKFPNVEAIKQAFSKQRDNCMNYVNTTKDDLHFHYWQHPATGTIDLYQTIILLAAHCKRHTLQIEEVKAQDNFIK